MGVISQNFSNFVGLQTNAMEVVAPSLSEKMKNLLVGIFLFVPSTLWAQRSLVFTTAQGAIRGYDPVAYFTEGREVMGKKEIVFDHLGAQWHFASEENLNLFKQDPEKYTPQFGGYCAYGMSRGYKAETQPNAWTIVQGKLYLNYNVDVRAKWSQDMANYIQNAEAHWPTVRADVTVKK
jgi:YHS domain-containing protein